MCTLVVLRRPGHDWPIVIAANRDEMIGRPWLPPARHWDDRPDVIAGRDELAGGSWLGINDHGVIAAVLNGRRSLGPQTGFRSRGELCLDALDYADASDALDALARIDPRAFRPFHLFVGDNRDAGLVSLVETETGPRIAAQAIAPGMSLITSSGINDSSHPRTRLYLPQFEAAPAPDPAAGDWTAWRTLMAARTHEPDAGHEGAMTIVTDSGYGTMSSSLIALPAPNTAGLKPVYFFAAGRPGEADYTPLTVG